MSRRLRAHETWDVRASALARNTHNLIRDIVENLQVEPNPDKQLIALSVGKYCAIQEPPLATYLDTLNTVWKCSVI